MVDLEGVPVRSPDAYLGTLGGCLPSSLRAAVALPTSQAHADEVRLSGPPQLVSTCECLSTIRAVVCESAKARETLSAAVRASDGYRVSRSNQSARATETGKHDESLTDRRTRSKGVLTDCTQASGQNRPVAHLALKSIPTHLRYLQSSIVVPHTILVETAAESAARPAQRVEKQPEDCSDSTRHYSIAAERRQGP